MEMNEERARTLLKPVWYEIDIWTCYPAHWEFLSLEGTKFNPENNAITIQFEEPRYSVALTALELDALAWWMRNKGKEQGMYDYNAIPDDFTDDQMVEELEIAQKEMKRLRSLNNELVTIADKMAVFVDKLSFYSSLNADEEIAKTLEEYNQLKAKSQL